MKFQLEPSNYDACPQYNDWIDEQYTEKSGLLDILGFQPRPSFVLFSLSHDTYQAAFADFLQQQEDELKEIVFSEFPSPIAYYFYRFQNGYENELQRLHLLRDSWEATIDFIHAITIAECRFLGVSLAEPISFSHLLTDSVAQRLLNVERIITHTNNSGITLDISRIAPLSTINTMRDLNQSRNAFSHSAAQSEIQAQNWIGDCYADVIDIMGELRELKDVDIFRYMGHVDGNTLRCEVFKGHGFTRTIRNVMLSPNNVLESNRYFQIGQILALINGKFIGLRPIVYYREEVTGHTTRLCIFRKTRGDAPSRRIEYEVIGEASRWDEDRTVFRVELTELRSLFGLGPD